MNISDISKDIKSKVSFREIFRQLYPDNFKVSEMELNRRGQLLRLSELSKARDRSIGISKAVRELHPYNFRGWPKLKLTSHYDHFDYLVVMRKHRALKTRERKWLRDNVVTWAPYFALRELDMSPRDAEWVRRQVDNIPPTFIIVGDLGGSPEDCQ